MESVLKFERKNYLFSRSELVDKDELFPVARFPAFTFYRAELPGGSLYFWGQCAT